MISTIISDKIVTVGDKVIVNDKNKSVVEILNITEADVTHDIILTVDSNGRTGTINAKHCRPFKE